MSSSFSPKNLPTTLACLASSVICPRHAAVTHSLLCPTLRARSDQRSRLATLEATIFRVTCSRLMRVLRELRLIRLAQLAPGDSRDFAGDRPARAKPSDRYSGCVGPRLAQASRSLLYRARFTPAGAGVSGPVLWAFTLPVALTYPPK